MDTFIKGLRAHHYQGLIQCVKIRVGDTYWFFNPTETLSTALKKFHPLKLGLSEIVQYVDHKNQLDITELVFTPAYQGPPKFVIQYPRDSPARTLPYFKPIRQHLGKACLFSPGISVIVENERNEIAIGKRADEAYWAFPAGAKELQEPLSDTVHLEVMEEFGITISQLQLMAIFSGEKCKTQYPNGDIMQYLVFLFKAKYDSGQLCANDAENTDVKWIPKDQVFSQVTEVLFKREHVYRSFKGSVLIDPFKRET